MENGKKVYVEEGDMTPLKAGTWQINNGNMAFVKTVSEASEPEEAPLVYRKGELVAYTILYYDYEKDPSRRGYFIYAHTPFNDGSHEKAAIVYSEDGIITTVGGVAVADDSITAAGITIEEAFTLAKEKGLAMDKPIDRFYVDGKYTVYHWQEDNTSRMDIPKGKDGYPAGNLIYDKESNVEQITFYVEGGGSVPWITEISTITERSVKNASGEFEHAEVKENDEYRIKVGVDDVEKDVLSLTTEVYKDKKLIYTHRKKNIEASASGNYPYIYIDTLPHRAEAGNYDVVCTIRDQSGAGIGTYNFSVNTEARITGVVNHTAKWEENRKKYNLSRFNDEVNHTYTMAEYMILKSPKKRGTNVFWSGEKFVLEAAVAGSPINVTCGIEGYGYSTTMTTTGKQNSKKEYVYEGLLWNNAMIDRWGNSSPQELTFTFTATYKGGIVKKNNVHIIMDNMIPYWRLRRMF